MEKDRETTDGAALGPAPDVEGRGHGEGEALLGAGRGEEEVVEDRPLPPGADDVLDGGVGGVSPPRVAVPPRVDRPAVLDEDDHEEGGADVVGEGVPGAGGMACSTAASTVRT